MVLLEGKDISIIVTVSSILYLPRLVTVIGGYFGWV